jgi:hypothetical protein
MPAIKHTIEEIDNFIAEVSGCEDGVGITKREGVYGLEVDDALVELRKRGLTSEYLWLKNAKKTPQYVRYNGKEIKLSSTYQVFNPTTGTHTAYSSEEEAHRAIEEIAQYVIKAYNVAICREIYNENGDSAWEPLPLAFKVDVKSS